MGLVLPKYEPEPEPVLIPIPIPVHVSLPPIKTKYTEPIRIPTKIRQDTPRYIPKYKIKSRFVSSFP